MKRDDAPLPPPAVVEALAHAWRLGKVEAHVDEVAEEVPVAFVVDGISHAVMLASPADLDDYALGFGLTEGLLASPAELLDVELVEGGAGGGLELRLTVTAACAWRAKARRRTLAGRTGCGLCGLDSLAQVELPLPQAPEVRIERTALARAEAALNAQQPMRHHTGATHAAAWCSLDGTLQLVREDVGRHNALDKLVGALYRAKGSPADGFLVVTSRASFEMVQKAAAAGIGLVAAVSAPTAYAVRTAERLNVALAGFVRGAGGSAYTFPERFGLTNHTPAGSTDGR